MSAQTVKPKLSSVEGDKHRQIDQINDMISALTTRLTDLHNMHKPGSSQHSEHEEGHGAGIITLAGTNVGATMRSDLSGRHDKRNDHNDHEDFSSDELEGLDTYVNSNFQAVNNSIMFSASYSANDPGVHMEITDMVAARGHKHDKTEKKGVKKGKEVAHSHDNQHSGFSE